MGQEGSIEALKKETSGLILLVQGKSEIFFGAEGDLNIIHFLATSFKAFKVHFVILL